MEPIYLNGDDPLPDPADSAEGQVALCTNPPHPGMIYRVKLDAQGAPFWWLRSPRPPPGSP